MRCVDCYYLDNPVTHGRNPKTCSDLGEKPSNTACQRFAPRGTSPRLPLAPTEPQIVSDKPIDYSFLKEFKTLMAEQLVIERDGESTIESIRAEFTREGIPADFEPVFEKYLSKLSDLRLLHHLCGLLDLAVYRDSIMACEIERAFGIRPQPQLTQKMIMDAITKQDDTNVSPYGLHEPPAGRPRANVGRASGGNPRGKGGRGLSSRAKPPAATQGPASPSGSDE